MKQHVVLAGITLYRPEMVAILAFLITILIVVSLLLARSILRQVLGPLFWLVLDFLAATWEQRLEQTELHHRHALALLEVEREYRAARREMNEASGQGWRNLADVPADDGGR